MTLFKLDENYAPSSFAAAPLVISYVLSSTVSIVTTVSGDARQYATVAIWNGSWMVWSATRTHAEPTATLPSDIILGSLTIKKGGTFNLQIPTTIQPGGITASLTLVTPNNPAGIPFNATVASWPLSS